MEAVGEYGGLDLSRTKPLAEVRSGYTYFRDGDVIFAKITPASRTARAPLQRDSRTAQRLEPPSSMYSAPVNMWTNASCSTSRSATRFAGLARPKCTALAARNECRNLLSRTSEIHFSRSLKRVSSEIERRGVLDVLRNGVKDSGVKFRLAYFRPASGLNEETRRLYLANLFSVVRQVCYSTKNENCLDLILFLNGHSDFHSRIEEPVEWPGRRRGSRHSTGASCLSYGLARAEGRNPPATRVLVGGDFRCRRPTSWPDPSCAGSNTTSSPSGSCSRNWCWWSR